MVNNKGSCIPLSLLNISHNNTFIMMAQKSKTATRQQQASRATHKKNNYHQCCLEIIQWVIIMLPACRVLKSSSSAVSSTQCQCIDLIFHYFNIAWKVAQMIIGYYFCADRFYIIPVSAQQSELLFFTEDQSQRILFSIVSYISISRWNVCTCLR